VASASDENPGSGEGMVFVRSHESGLRS
jgi:hypothetical protein